MSHKFELEQLSEVLAKLEALDPLPKAATPEAAAMPHGEWMSRHKEVIELHRDAELYALLALPDEVLDALDAVKRRKNVLLNIEEWSVTYQRIQQEHEQQQKGDDATQVE